MDQVAGRRGSQCVAKSHKKWVASRMSRWMASRTPQEPCLPPQESEIRFSRGARPGYGYRSRRKSLRGESLGGKMGVFFEKNRSLT